MPVTLKGVIGIPDGEGPFPVVLFVHGSYEFCTIGGTGDADAYPCPEENFVPQYEGFTYLAEALAERGYITVIPDLSAEFNNGFGEPIPAQRSTQIITQHLEQVVSGDGFEIDLADKADMSQLLIATHSRGGALAINFITDDMNPVKSVSGLMMITPAAIHTEHPIPENLPTALIIAECDGDVGTDQPLFFLDEQLPPLRPTLTSIYTLPAATHNAFSTLLGEDPRQVCDAPDLLAPQFQRDFIVQFMPDFFDMALAYGQLYSDS